MNLKASSRLSKDSRRVLFFGKQNDPFCEKAADFVKSRFEQPLILIGRRGDPFPDVGTEAIDIVISYLSPWIIPANVLKQAKTSAINFHPGPPEYPGIGCTNFAIYEDAKTFGVTCHHMEPAVDTGKVIATSRFPISKNDTVYALTQRCYQHIFDLFNQVMTVILEKKPLPVSSEHWTRKPFKRSELNDLCRLTKDMSPEEMARRIRAVTFPGMPGAYIELAGTKFIPANTPS